MKNESGNRKRHVMLVLTILVLLSLCGLKLAERFWHIRKYDAMGETDASEPEGTEPKGPAEPGEAESKETEAFDPDAARHIDFEALKARNEDVVAWILIPGTVINYPVLWKAHDNEYYLHRDIDRREGSYEGVFLDGDSAPDFSSRQNLFYGHHMKNKTMFTAICDFKDERFFREHRRVYLYTPEHTYVLRPMACLYTSATAEKRRVEFADQIEFDAYVDEMTKGCSFREIPNGGVAQLFSFVTCSYEFQDARTILYCYEVDADGNPVTGEEWESRHPVRGAAPHEK